MNTIRPYLRVVAGFFAGVCTWVAIVDLIHLDVGAAVISLLFAAGLWYLAVGRPIRDHLARIKADNAALAARAQAGHEAFLAGNTAAAFAPPPEAAPRKPIRKGVLAASILAALFVLIGIIGDISDGLDNTSTTTPSTQPATHMPDPAVPGAPAAQTLMPNVVCMNLQAAQDTIQETGVYYSRSEDATGKQRMQVSDRNWVVVEQSPAPGTPIGEGGATLSVVKYGEPGDCS
ncbi:PASTA domain-containing protein [Prescottella subtropica]|uniref:PASTA domain-containing protein n=1 Tax=Prescottella subtropica TaxID=2545757 RepID=UPI0010F68F12|nr:PASTA domain-containing protein [Prescottella subtropica]